MSEEEQPETGYCHRCNNHVVVENLAVEQLKSGRWALKGNCPDCGTNISKFISEQKALDLLESE